MSYDIWINGYIVSNEFMFIVEEVIDLLGLLCVALEVVYELLHFVHFL